MNYLVSIGLEVHVQLRTVSKMFCGCATGFGAPPNTHVCPVCLGYPGTLPVMNQDAIHYTVVAGLLLGSNISDYSKFDRKSYFYPDMPKNYQISQYDRPLCDGGSVDIEIDGLQKQIGITRIHLEEDVGKSTHFSGKSGVDFNRAGIPLMEIVTEPDITSADEAMSFLVALKQIMLYGEVSGCNLEEGNMRCDVNCSVRPETQSRLGTKTEIKNMNTFKGVHAALLYEIDRQVQALESGEQILQETRRWDPDAGITIQMRVKESEHDYRYFPEPDLMPVVLDSDKIEEWRAQLPELPRERRTRFVEQYGLPDYDAGILVEDKALADYYEEAAKQSANPKAISNWMMTEMLRLLSERGLELGDIAMKPESLAGLVKLTDSNTINSSTAREVFGILFAEGGDPAHIVKEKGLAQVGDSDLLDKLVKQAILDNPRSVEDYRSGKKAAAQFLVGQVMRLTKGKANPKLVQDLLRTKLDG